MLLALEGVVQNGDLVLTGGERAVQDGDLVLTGGERAVQDGDLVLTGGERAIDEGAVWWRHPGLWRRRGRAATEPCAM